MTAKFIKVGTIYINPDTVRMVSVNKTDVDIYFIGIMGCRTVSIGDAEPLIALLNTLCL